MDIVSVGPEGGEVKIALDDGSGLRKDFLDKTYVKKALGKPAKKIIAEENTTIRESQKKLKETVKEFKNAVKLHLDLVEAKQKKQDLLTKIEKNNAKIEQLGSNVENKSELDRLKQLEKNYQTDLKNTEKELEALNKQLKDKRNKQKRVNQLSDSLAAEVEKRNTLEEKLNSTKTLDEINEEKQKEQCPCVSA